MITRPVLSDSFSLQNSGESALHCIVFDDSFSMQGSSDIVVNTVTSILKQIPDKGQLIWINLNKGIQYRGLKEDMPSIENLLSYTYLTGSLIDGLSIIKNDSNNQNISREIYIITDSQHESLKELWEHSDYYENMHLFTIIKPRLNDNLAITNVQISSEILAPNHTIDIEVRVKNNGMIDKEDIIVQLIIDNMSVGQQLVYIPKGSEKSFLFKTALPKPGFYQATVELEADERQMDNIYHLNLYIPDQRNIALISASQEESYYIQASMKALNKTGKSLTISEHYSLEDPTLKLENMDAVFIISPSIVAAVADSKIEEYLYNGGHLIILPGINSNPLDYSIINTLAQAIEGKYKNLSFSGLSSNSFQDINLSSIQIRDIYNLFLSATGESRNIRFFKYLKLPYDPMYSQLLLNDGNSIWNRYIVNSGIIDIFGFAMNLNWTNFPIKGTFLPFMHFIAHSQSNKNMSETVGSHWNVILDDYYSEAISHVLPNGSRQIINTDGNNHIITDKLELPGFHSLYIGDMNFSQVAVNIDEIELNSNYANIEELKDEMPMNMQIIPMESDVLKIIKQARIGIEIWRYILYLIIILVMIEMLISNVKRKK